jgi:hypothetical protein
MRIISRKADAPARTEHLRNTSEELYRYASPIDNCGVGNIYVLESAILFGIRQYSGAVTAGIKKPPKKEKNKRLEMSKRQREEKT